MEIVGSSNSNKITIYIHIYVDFLWSPLEKETITYQFHAGQRCRKEVLKISRKVPQYRISELGMRKVQYSNLTQYWEASIQRSVKGSVDFKDFKDNNPQKTVKLVQSRLYPQNLKSTMAQHLEYKEGLTRNLKTYLKSLMKEELVHHKITDTHTNRFHASIPQREKVERTNNSNSTTILVENKSRKVSEERKHSEDSTTITVINGKENIHINKFNSSLTHITLLISI